MSDSRWRAALDMAAVAASVAIPAYDPNPAVGCTLLSEDGSIVSVGSHRGVGTPHAEVDALSQAGERARGTTVVVTLMPCDHVGNTDSCAQALITAGVARVVFAHDDPTGHARTTVARLREAGIEVIGPIAPQIGADVLGSWLRPHLTGLPHVVWKVASSLDGRIGDQRGDSTWITGKAARADVQKLRAAVGAIITSTQTVLTDDPLLNVRLSGTSRQPLRVVVGLRDLPAGARIHGTDGHLEQHRTRHVREVLTDLATRGVHRVLLECGSRLARAFLSEGLIDEMVWYHAGLVLPGGLDVVDRDGIINAPQFLLQTAPRWRAVDVRIIGGEIRSTWIHAGRPEPTTSGA